MKKKIISVLSAFIYAFLTTTAFAQIYNYGDDCFYAKAGSSECSYVVKFEGSKGRIWLKSVSHSTVRSNLNKDKKFYENQVWTDGKESAYMYEYDRSKSTYKVEVYKRKSMAQTERLNQWGTAYDPYTGRHLGWDSYQNGWNYVAVAKDKSSIIMWFEKLNNYTGDVSNKTEYSRIPKEDLLPKSVNYDFLQ